MKVYTERECSNYYSYNKKVRQYELDSKAMSYSQCFGIAIGIGEGVVVEQKFATFGQFS